jgi:DNA mismatch repair protein MutL
LKSTRIHQLDNILANQIAAGEVVERPASVVKELIENSIDAGAMRIDIEVERGGAGLIRVKDDGTGIHPDDLTLALSRHATSKIHQTEDLSAITSLGFRGEALASISSVSKLDLISKWHQSDQALKAEAHGRDMDVTVSPAGLKQGTLVEVRELFFNTPARRRFMRTDKTEFRNIDAVVTKIALSHPHISFMLKHNGKKICQYIAAKDRRSQELRVGQILGKDFIQNCMHFSLEHEVESASIKFSGWLGLPTHHRSMNDGQFVFINNRAVKDKVVSHAIREAYADLLPQGRLPAYIINIEMDPETVDVNVHPTKHEVRFQHQRMVHDLIIRAIAEVLSESNKEIQSEINSEAAENSSVNGSNNSSIRTGYFQNKTEDYKSSHTLAESAQVYGEFINSSFTENKSVSFVVENQYLILPIEGQILLISIDKYIQHRWPIIWMEKVNSGSLDISPILFPVSFAVTEQESNAVLEQKSKLDKVGLKFHFDDKNKTGKLLSVPSFLAGIFSEKICELTFDLLNQENFIEKFCDSLANDKNAWQSIIDYHQLQNNDAVLSWLYQQIDFKPESNCTEIFTNSIKHHSNWLRTLNTDALHQLFQQSKNQ